MGGCLHERNGSSLCEITFSVCSGRTCSLEAQWASKCAGDLLIGHVVCAVGDVFVWMIQISYM
jgi:hypothetical protein